MPKDTAGIMGEFKRGELHSGSSKGKVVTSPKQAIAIALAEKRKASGDMTPSPAMDSLKRGK